MNAPYQPSTWMKEKGVAQGQQQALDAASIARIRGHLAALGSPRDRALFEVAIDTTLRGGDLLRLRVREVVDHVGAVREAFPVIQGKISGGKAHTVTVYLTELTRSLVGQLIARERKAPSEYLFTGIGRRHWTPAPSLDVPTAPAAKGLVRGRGARPDHALQSHSAANQGIRPVPPDA